MKYISTMLPTTSQESYEGAGALYHTPPAVTATRSSTVGQVGATLTSQEYEVGRCWPACSPPVHAKPPEPTSSASACTNARHNPTLTRTIHLAFIHGPLTHHPLWSPTGGALPAQQKAPAAPSGSGSSTAFSQSPCTTKPRRSAGSMLLRRSPPRRSHCPAPGAHRRPWRSHRMW